MPAKKDLYANIQAKRKRIAKGSREKMRKPRQKELGRFAEIREALLLFASARSDGTFCPSEVARELKPEDWRPLMPAIREVAEHLVEEGRLRCWQKGAPASATQARGPIRLRS